MPRKSETCFVCGSTENVVCTFPQNRETFDQWVSILELSKPFNPADRKKICVLHFEEKWHKILLEKNARRGPFIFPIKMKENENNNSQIDEIMESHVDNSFDQQDQLSIVSKTTDTAVNNNKRPLSPVSLTPSAVTLHNTNKKPVNLEILLQSKSDEIDDMTNKIKQLQLENRELKKKMKSTEANTLDQVLNDLPEKVQILVKMLVKNNAQGKRYSKDEKIFCQSLYYRNPGYYKFLREFLCNAIPSKITMLNWQTFKSISTGVVPQIVSYLKDIGRSLNDSDRKLVLIMDEMDGRRGLQYDQRSDAIVGFESLHKKTNVLAKKFLTFMIRGLSGHLGNLIIANYATAKGITGIFLKFKLSNTFNLLTFCL